VARNTARKRVRRKRLERRIRDALIRLLRAVIRRSPEPDAPQWDARPHRVLYLRYDKIGDMILATGVIRAIARSHPTITVDVLASRANAAVLEGNPYVGRIILFEKKRPWTYLRTYSTVRKARYDAVIDTKVQAASFTDAALMLLSGARHRIGVAGRDTEFALTVAVPPLESAVHYVDHSSALIAAFGAPTREEGADVRPEIFLAAAERERAGAEWARMGVGTRLLVNVSAGDSSRYWPEEKFVATLAAAGRHMPALAVLILRSPVDSERAKRIASAIGGAVADTPSVRDAFALAAAADVVFTADTSIAHAASAFSKPAVVLFPRGRGALYGPYQTAGRVVATPASSIRFLDAEPVIAALLAVLDVAATGRFEPWPATTGAAVFPSAPRPFSPSAGTAASRSAATDRSPSARP
jgi:ADP-heptose:LPS heptosyltransferase